MVDQGPSKTGSWPGQVTINSSDQRVGWLGDRGRTGRACWLTGLSGGLSLTRLNPFGGMTMKWKTPVIIEIAVGMEINCYACAEI